LSCSRLPVYGEPFKRSPWSTLENMELLLKRENEWPREGEREAVTETDRRTFTIIGKFDFQKRN